MLLLLLLLELKCRFRFLSKTLQASSSDGSVLAFLTAKQEVPGLIPGAGGEGKLHEETPDAFVLHWYVMMP